VSISPCFFNSSRNLGALAKFCFPVDLHCNQLFSCSFKIYRISRCNLWKREAPFVCEILVGKSGRGMDPRSTCQYDGRYGGGVNYSVLQIFYVDFTVIGYDELGGGIAHAVDLYLCNFSGSNRQIHSRVCY
jgi:hypothetical protein